MGGEQVKNSEGRTSASSAAGNRAGTAVPHHVLRQCFREWAQKIGFKKMD